MLRAATLFSQSIEQNARDTKMRTLVMDIREFFATFLSDTRKPEVSFFLSFIIP